MQYYLVTKRYVVAAPDEGRLREMYGKYAADDSGDDSDYEAVQNLPLDEVLNELVYTYEATGDFRGFPFEGFVEGEDGFSLTRVAYLPEEEANRKDMYVYGLDDTVDEPKEEVIT